MCQACRHKPAEPLDEQSIKEFKEEGWQDLLVELDGKTYSDEDLHHCDNFKECGFRTPDYHELDDDGLCEACAEGAREYAAYVEDVRWTYRHSVL